MSLRSVHIRRTSSRLSLGSILEIDDEDNAGKRQDTCQGPHKVTSHTRSAGIGTVRRLRHEMGTTSLLSLDDLYEVETSGHDRSIVYKRRSLHLVDTIMTGSSPPTSRRDSTTSVNMFVLPAHNSERPEYASPVNDHTSDFSVATVSFKHRFNMRSRKLLRAVINKSRNYGCGCAAAFSCWSYSKPSQKKMS